jgi:hypothetical protein
MPKRKEPECAENSTVPKRARKQFNTLESAENSCRLIRVLAKGLNDADFQDTFDYMCQQSERSISGFVGHLKKAKLSQPQEASATTVTKALDDALRCIQHLAANYTGTMAERQHVLDTCQLSFQLLIEYRNKFVLYPFLAGLKRIPGTNEYEQTNVERTLV